jgi:hypothetical protein
MSLRVRRSQIGIFSVAGAMLLLASGCGGGGGSSAGLNGGDSDPVIPLVGNPGVLSQTPTEANSSDGSVAPPNYDAQVTSTSHWFRIVSRHVNRSSLLSKGSIYLPFSTLNGNITVNDKNGAHVPGIAMLNGTDAFGVNRSKQSGFPHDVQGGVDMNVGPNVFLYVADVDGNLATPAAWGPSPDGVTDTTTATVDLVRVGVSSVNGWSANTLWTFRVGTTALSDPPSVASVASEVKDPTDPTNPNSTASRGSFIVQFSEPMVPQSVGRSAALNGFPFDANLPVPPFASRCPTPDHGEDRGGDRNALRSLRLQSRQQEQPRDLPAHAAHRPAVEVNGGPPGPHVHEQQAAAREGPDEPVRDALRRQRQPTGPHRREDHVLGRAGPRGRQYPGLAGGRLLAADARRRHRAIDLNGWATRPTLLAPTQASASAPRSSRSPRGTSPT